MILNEDRCREEHLFHILAEKENPYNHFGCGNKETLSRETNLREKLLNFNKSFYSSNKMKLSVYSNYSLEEMSETVKNLFSPVISLYIYNNKNF